QNSISIAVGNGTICAGDSFTLSPSGATSYTFSSGSAVITPTASGSYSVWGSAAGCTASAPGVASVTVKQLPVITVQGGTVCAGASFTFNPSGAGGYTYSSGSSVVSPINTTTFSVFGTDANGCKSIPVIAEVTVHPLPLVQAAASNPSLCKGESTLLMASGAL